MDARCLQLWLNPFSANLRGEPIGSLARGVGSLALGEYFLDRLGARFVELRISRKRSAVGAKQLQDVPAHLEANSQSRPTPKNGDRIRLRPSIA